MKSSGTRNAISCLFSLLLFVFSSMPVAAKRPPISPSRITAMKVSTLQASEAKLDLSDDLFADQRGNAPVSAGMGAANYPEHYLVVLVETTGNTSSKVELRATEGRRLVWRKISEAYYEKGGYDREDLDNPRSYAIFFIEGTRCETLKLTARVVGPGRPSSMTRTIEFACGE